MTVHHLHQLVEKLHVMHFADLVAFSSPVLATTAFFVLFSHGVIRAGVSSPDPGGPLCCRF